MALEGSKSKKTLKKAKKTTSIGHSDQSRHRSKNAKRMRKTKYRGQGK